MLLDKGLRFGIDLERYEKDEPAKSQIVTKDLTASPANVMQYNDKSTTAAQGHQDDNNFVQDYEQQTQMQHKQQRQPQEVTYKWMTSDWSECSQKCGALGPGLRVRM